MGAQFYATLDPNDKTLQQGDILRVTPALHASLTEVHPHFTAEKYAAFQVITQTCDLVQEGQRSAKPYVEICVVRYLEEYIPRLLRRIYGIGLGSSIFLESHRNQILALLHRILNQNESSHGLFYLHPDGARGISRDSVSVLRVSVALRADTHWEKLLEARSGRLNPAFQAKLGWMTGHLYARAATPDWHQVRGYEKDTETTRAAKELLDSLSPHWVRESWLKAARAQGDFDAGLDDEELVRRLRQFAPPKKKARAIEAVLSVLEATLEDFPPDTRNRVRKRLENDAELAAAIPKEK